MINKKTLIRIFLLLWLIGALLGFILHLFFPYKISNLSFWNSSIGWQREIALWNLGAIFIIIYSLIKNNQSLKKFTITILLFLSSILGTNHIIEIMLNKKAIIINLLGALANYIIVIFGIFIIQLKDDKK